MIFEVAGGVILGGIGLIVLIAVMRFLWSIIEEALGVGEFLAPPENEEDDWR